MDVVIEYIIKNGKTPISAKQLSGMFGVSGLEIRRQINEARSEGCPICSCRKGYYYSEDIRDIVKTASSLSRRIESIERARNGLLLRGTV